MSRGAKIILLVFVAVLIIATILLLAFRLPRGAAPEAAVNRAPVGGLPQAPAVGRTAPAAANVNGAVSAPSPAVQASEAERTRAEILRLSTQFAERFGSYSSQGNFENITDLEPLQTDSMKAWADQYIVRARASRGENPEYIGVTTRAVSPRITDFSESAGTATVRVSTQREEVSGTSAARRVYYQDIVLDLRRVGGVWLVDAAAWQS
ncbi:hypothetical protein A3D72_03900 [Candidatus Uhrbacteria bacterium RIFCSPHIGHO2_02_FULL_57_19]|uniref:Tim44-like domain-containing protein n=1 Tax=Candidatus Uhrbacteria bacterium RIFCSPHIGHO2_02_FULL_57_19 TaxID=1802391 RepID=A0A1F7U6X2_9BACT|nr:MAG: hypothetical protein A3D72_03900 [Candidatus Uhrbacteria bacterium RIFCSPHIGHO2_02_FULL_57_19]